MYGKWFSCMPSADATAPFGEMNVNYPERRRGDCPAVTLDPRAGRRLRTAAASFACSPSVTVRNRSDARNTGYTGACPPGEIETVLVSHRFSTVLMADRIAVLDQGRLAEFGSHRNLMAAGGLYAELFALQARAYG